MYTNLQKIWKSMLGILLALVLLLTNPIFSFQSSTAETSSQDPATMNRFVSGCIEPDIEIPPQPLRMQLSGVLPTNYDGRNYQSPVKEQRQSGICWTFGTLAAIEASAIKNGFSAPGANAIDLSEYHVATALSKNLENTLGFNRGVNDGGHAEMVTAYIMRNQLNGLVKESNDPLIFNNSGTVDERNPSITSQKKPSYTVSNINRITYATFDKATDMSHVKQAIMDYGAVSTYMCIVNEFFTLDSGNSAYYLDPDRAALHQNDGHMVAIVGWDDYYSKDNFMTGTDRSSGNMPIKKPKNNGAWLIKNSWGTNWGDNGYAWISYDDTAIATWCYAFETVKNYSSTNEKMYEYDPFGYGGTVGYSAGSAAYGANVFTSGSTPQILKEIKVYVPSAPDTITLYYVPNYVDQSSLDNVATQEPIAILTAPYAGYYTVPIEQSAETVSRFAIVAKYGNRSIPIENDWQASAKVGESLISSSGITGWSDYSASANVNFCIKAVTIPVPTPIVVRKGDVNCDGTIEIADVQLVLKAYLRLITLTDKQLWAADVLNNGEITLANVQIILKIALQLLPIPE